MFKKAKEYINDLLEFSEKYEPEIYSHLNSVIKLDVNGNSLSFNEVFTKQFGYTEGDFKEPFLEVFTKSDIIDPKKIMEKVLLGRTQKFNTIGVKKNGQTTDIHITVIPIKVKTKTHIYVIVKNNLEIKQRDKDLLLFKKKQNTLEKLENICEFYLDTVNDLYYFSNQLSNLLGINKNINQSLPLKKFLDYIHPDDRNRVYDTIQHALNTRKGYQVEYRISRNSDEIDDVVYITEQADIVLDRKGYIDGIIGYIQNISNSKISDTVVKKEKQLAQLYNNPDVGFWSMNLHTGGIQLYSKGIEHITGYKKDDFAKVNWISLVHEEDVKQYLENQTILEGGQILHHQYRIYHKDGGIRWVQDYTISALDDSGKLIELNGLTIDITEQKTLNEKIQFITDYDPLTKLPNRKKFIEHLEQLLENPNNTNHFAIVKLDIDHFKYVNDTLGHQVGDELLIQVAERISINLTSSDMIIRESADSFMILINKIESIESLEVVINKIRNSINEPFYISDFQLYNSVSMGISIYPENGKDSLELLRNADLALYKAQKQGKNNYQFLSPSNSIQSFKNYSLGRDLKKAIENNEMILHYQPRMDSSTNQMVAAEALIRWNHSEWGLISPKEFLSLAEENGLISDIDEWVLRNVCLQIKEWKNKGMNIPPVSINVSSVNFLKQNWPDLVAKIVKDVGIQPIDIEIEITESTLLINDLQVKEAIEALQSIGIKIALDDFGTGFSSISYLKKYQADILKIDKSFIENIHTSDRDLFILKSIIYMAKGLQMKVVAEGVETFQQLELLQNEQCYEIQGYLYSRPVPIDEFEALFEKRELLPTDPEMKAKDNKRQMDRLNLPDLLEADMNLISISGRKMELGTSNVLIKDISTGGLSYVSTLKLPVRGDVIFRFETEILNKLINLHGIIIWKEEMNEDLVEYGVQFVMDEAEKPYLTSLINNFSDLLLNGDTIPSYRSITEDPYQYFNRIGKNHTK